MCAVVGLDPEVAAAVRIALLVAAPLVALGPLVAMKLAFERFRRWRARLGFSLHGWEVLVDDPSLAKTSWRPCRITLSLRDEKDAELARAALTVFAERANRCFYYSESDDGPNAQRKRWTVEGLEAKGSANAVVIWAIHELCTGEVSMLARRGALERVLLEIQGDAFSVSEGSLSVD